jgi:hypothetical protein
VPQVQISLPTELTDEHLQVALKYFESTARLTPREWRIALECFDVLGKAEVAVARRRSTFLQAYGRYVDRRFADDFIAKLIRLEDLRAEADGLEQQTSRDVLAALERGGLYDEKVPNSEYFAAYCLYWWSAFARGYRFEVTILRDLEAAGIVFHAHDLTKRNERMSPYDLVVLRQLGDIKHTTYFLHTARTRRLQCDFYVTRLYDSRRRRYVSIVVLQEPAWRAINGPVTEAPLESAADFFPDAVQVVFDQQRLVIVSYEEWKRKVKEQQAEDRTHE